MRTPNLVNEGAKRFGSQCIVVAIDAKRDNDHWKVYINGGRIPTGHDALAWAREVESRGAGEILLTSMDHDGTKGGYALELTSIMADTVSIPIIASGGAGNLEHFSEVLTEGGASAALAASLFHYQQLSVGQVKEYLQEKGVLVRL